MNQPHSRRWRPHRFPPVDPAQVEACLAALRSFPAVDPSADLATLRAATRVRQAAMNFDDAPVCAVEDIALGADARPGLRLYTPADPDGSLVVYVHGGGFVQGDLETVDPQCRILASLSDARVASLDYRLAPEHRFPAAVDDILAAASWLAANADRLDVDLDRVAVAGESSGGNLAAVLSHHLVRNGPFRCRGQALVYPVTDLRCATPSFVANAVTPTLTAARMRWYAGQYAAQPGDALDPRASPLLAEDLSGLPPTMLVIAGADPLADEGRAYGKLLEASGVELTLLDFPGLYHGFWGWGRRLTVVRELLELTAGFVRHVTASKITPA